MAAGSLKIPEILCLLAKYLVILEQKQAMIDVNYNHRIYEQYTC